MRFLIQSSHAGNATDRATARTLNELFRDLDFCSPKHLMDTLRDHFTLNSLSLEVGQVAGVVTVSSANGVLLRFRSPN